MERIKETPTYNQYVYDNGLPDRERIFVRTGDTLRERLDEHVDPNLLKILKNQPDPVKDVVNDHLYKKNDGKGCPRCLEAYKLKGKKEEGQIGLPLEE